MDLYCKIFIDSDKDRNELFCELVSFMGGKAERFDIECDWCGAYLANNSWYSEKEYAKDPSDFVNWRYYLEIQPNDTEQGRIEQETYIQALKELLVFLRQLCRGAVPSCDYEEIMQNS